MRYAFKAALFAAVSLTALPAWAQNADDELVVTATRVQTPITNLPADVTVIDAEAALSRGQTTLVQMLEEAPGLGAVQ